MGRYKYRAINNRGRPVRGVITAVNEVDLHNQLQNGGLELVSCASMDKKKGFLANFGTGKKVKTRDLIQLFFNLEQMQGAGVPLLDSLSDIRDTTEHACLRRPTTLSVSALVRTINKKARPQKGSGPFHHPIHYMVPGISGVVFAFALIRISLSFLY